MTYGVRRGRGTENGDETGSYRYASDERKPSRSRIKPVKRTNIDLQLFFKLTDDSVRSMPFIFNVFHSK